MRIRSTIRWRLTVLYGLLFLVTGVALLSVGYVVVRQSLLEDEGRGGALAVERYDLDPEGVERFLEVPLPGGPYTDDSGDRAHMVGDVITGVQRDIREDTLHQLLRGSAMALALLCALALGLGWVAAGRALAPVKRLTAAAQRLSDENLHERIDLDGPDDELKELADTLDAMLARLEVAFQSQRRFAADVSHEIRTPLAIIKAEAEVTIGDALSSERERRLARAVLDAANRAEALVDSLLALARSESTMHEREPVDLAALAGDVVGERVVRADAAGVELELDLGSAVVDGDPFLLERLVANLVDNGINHNVERDGWLRVTVDSENGTGVLEVSNTGGVLTPQEVERITEPFHRLGDDSRPGFGLGMTIVRSVVEAHEGNVRISPRAGGGLDVVVELPTLRPARGRRAAL